MYQYYDDDKGVMIVYIALPEGINEAVTPNPDGTYTIFISTDICEEKQKQAFEHAMWHIKNDDFWKADVNEVEANAHAVSHRETGV